MTFATAVIVNRGLMATAASKDSTLPAITKNPSFVAEEAVSDFRPIIDLIDYEVSHKIQLESYPTIAQFVKFTPGLMYNQSIRVRNTSTKIQRTYVSNPMTKWFSIKVNKEHNLLPGLDLTIFLKFKPDQERYYYDRLRISYQSGESLFIPIHAFPILPSVDFPSNVNLRESAVGEVTTYTIPITCTSPIELKFHLQFQPLLSCCQVEPIEGILYAGIPVEVVLTFQPEMTTSFQQNLNLSVLNVDMNVLTCKIIYKKTTRRDKSKILSQSTEVKKVSKPLRLKKISPVLKSPSTKKESAKMKKEDGGNFNPSWCSLGLIDIYKINCKQTKEKQFLEEQKKIQDDKTTLSRRQTKLGSLPISSDEKLTILKHREISWERFKQRDMLVDKNGLSRREVTYATKRTLVDVEDKPKNYIFSFHMSNEWPSRILTLRRLINAVNKIVTRNRASKRLECLRNFLKKDEIRNVLAEPIEPEKKFSMCLDNIKPPSFSKLFWCPRTNLNLLWPGLRPAPSKPLNFGDVFVSKPVPEIKPLLHEILGYKLQDAYEAGANYTPRALKPPPDPDCAMVRLISFVEARDSCAKQPKEFKHVFEPPHMDPRKFFNPYPEIPEIIPLPITSELEQEFALFPLNTWQRKEEPKSDLTIDELAENVTKCQHIGIVQVTNDGTGTETKMTFPPQAKFKLELPPLETVQSDTYLKTATALLQAQANATTVEETLTCDNHSHTSSSNAPN